MKYVQKVGEDYKVSDILQPKATKFWELKEGITTAALSRYLEGIEDKDLAMLELGEEILKSKIPFKPGYPKISILNSVPDKIVNKDIYCFSKSGRLKFSSKMPLNNHFVIKEIGASFTEYFGSLVEVDAESFSSFIELKKTP